MRLIVVGAGVAGLTAADAARNAGADVVVLEARQRTGGRIRTEPLGPGSTDLGASWVHAPLGNPVAEALAAAGIGTRNDGAYCSRMAVWRDGWVEAPEATTFTAAVEADWDPAEALAALDGSDRYVDGVEWYLEDRELEGSLGELARFGLLWMNGALVIAGPPERISLAGAAEYGEGSGGNLVPAGGYRALVERLAAGLDVRLGGPVLRIEHGDGGVIVHSGDEAFVADRTVVTVPLGVLKAGQIAFDPPLGAEHAAALERLEMATLEKIALRFGERFWPEEVWQITHVSEERTVPVWLDFTRHVGAPTLMAFYNPAITPALADRSAEQRVKRALECLRAMFGRVPDPEEALASDWTRDPWSHGAYSYIPIGASADDMRRLANPVSNRLSLAGEATVPEHYGTVQAAFTSGLRAAAWALGERPERLTLGPIPPRWLE